MSIKQKFESIDQSQLSENQKEILGKIKTATKDFTITDQKALDKVDSALDNIITKLKATNPQAIKGESKKQEPKAKKEVVKKEPKSETKKPKKAKKEAGGKRTIFSIAKEIRKADESWEDAKARAKKVMETEKEDTTKKMKSETDKLLAFIKRRKELEGLSGTSVKKDSKIEALPKGRRISKKGWKNQYGESEGGRVYYENRDNRTDRLAPSFDDKIYLADGGALGEELMGGQSNSSLKPSGYRLISSKGREIIVSDDDGKTKERWVKNNGFSGYRIVYKGNDYEFTDSFADGGTIIGTPETPLGRDLGISYTGLVGETGAMSSGEMFADGGQVKFVDNFSNEDGIQVSKSKTEDGKTFYTAFITSYPFRKLVPMNEDKDYVVKRAKKIYFNMLEYKKNEKFEQGGSTGLPAGAEQQFVNYYLGEGASAGIFEQGGSLVDGYLTDPNFGDFQAGIYDNGGNLDDLERQIEKKENLLSILNTQDDKNTDLKNQLNDDILNLKRKLRKDQKSYMAEGGSLGNHGLKQGDQIIKTMSGGVQKVKTRTGDIVYVNLANGYRGAEPPLPFDKGGRTTERRFVNHGQDYEVRYAKDKPKRRGYGYADGGTIIGNPETPLGRDLGISYTGLVGETGAMSSGEMFADGGTIDAFQMRTVRGVDNKPTEVLTDEQKVQFAKGGEIVKGQEVGLKFDSEYHKDNLDVFVVEEIKNGNYRLRGKKNGNRYSVPKERIIVYSYATGGGVGKSFRKKRNEYLEKLGQKEGDVWDKIGANSGADIRNSDKLLKAYAEGVQEMLQKEEVGKGSFDQEDYDFYTDENWHLFNEFLVWNGYYDPEITKTEKAWREDRFKDPKYRNYVSNPKIISLSGGSKSKSTNYVAKDKISTITIVKDGKEIVLSSKDVLNGVNLYDGGGKLKNDHTYFAKRYIKEVVMEDGDKLKPSNGYWVKKSALDGFKNKVSLAKKPKFKVDDLVYNKRTKSVGIVRIAEEKGEVKTDADGNVSITELEVYNPLKFKHQSKSKVAPSTQKEIDERGLFKPFSKFEVGGKTTFKEKATAIAKNFEGKKVEPKYQKEYGKVYDKAEAKEVGNKIAGSQKAKYDSKMSGGGTTKRGGAMVLAKQIRKDGESWASALKRANEQMRKK